MALRKRVVVVGLGSIGRRHARLLLERDDVRVELVEPSSEVLASARRELGDLPSHSSFEVMLETSPPIVLIATPTPLHAAQTISALNAGAHVFCEKPMADSLAAARQMKEAADRSARVFNVGFCLHFWPALMALKDLVRRGVLGQVLHAHAWVGSYATLVNSVSRHQAHQPGALFWDYSHQPDLFYWILGKIPTAVQAAALQAGSLELSSNPNVAVTTCEYNSPLISTIHLNYVQLPARHHYEVCGDEGWAFVDGQEATVKVGSRKQESVEVTKYPSERDDMFRAEHQAFLEMVNGTRAPETSAAEGLVSTAICEAAVESWKTRQRVAVKV